MTDCANQMKKAPELADSILVLQVITKGETGGAQTHVLTLCEALADRVRFQAIIGGTEPITPLGQALQMQGVPVHRLTALSNTLSPWRVLVATIALRRLIRTLRPDVIHAHSAVAGVVARLAGWVTHTPVIYTVHGFGFKPEIPRLQRWVARLAESLLAPLTSHMICVSEYERQLARQLPLGAGRLSVIPNALADTSWRAEPSTEPAQIVMVARLAPPKRPDLILHALALLRDRLGRETATLLIGDGPQMAALRSLARQLKLERVEFVGDVKDVPQRLSQASVFVLASDHEGLPISVIEAMRAGLPVVASDLSGLRELITPNIQGLLQPNETEALAHALISLVKSPSLRARLGHAARMRYEADYTPPRMAAALVAIYQQLAPSPSHASIRSPHPHIKR